MPIEDDAECAQRPVWTVWRTGRFLPPSEFEPSTTQPVVYFNMAQDKVEVAGSCQHGNEHSRSTKWRAVLD